jgi:hypothetical protein
MMSAAAVYTAWVAIPPLSGRVLAGVFRGQTADLNYFSFPQWRGRFRGDALCVEREVDLALGLLLRSIGDDDGLVMLGLADTGAI